MKLYKILGVAGLACVLGSMAAADEVDFYKFRTKHSPDANKESKFYAKVLETSISDSRVDNEREHKCYISPKAPQNFSCKVRGEWLYLEATKESALKILAEGYAVKADEIVEVEAKSTSVYQVLLKNDRVFHVVMKAPSVVDDSMECEVAVVMEKSRAIFRCRSEFYHDKKFEVRDVPVYATHAGYLFLGSAKDSRNAEADAKIREIIEGMSRLKQATLVGNVSSIYNIGIALSGETGTTAIRLNHYSYSYGRYNHRTGYESTALSSVVVRGKVQHVHRGLNGRRGD